MSPDHWKLLSQLHRVHRARAIVPLAQAAAAERITRELRPLHGGKITAQEWQSGAPRRNQTALDFPSPWSLRRGAGGVCGGGGGKQRKEPGLDFLMKEGGHGSHPDTSCCMTWKMGMDSARVCSIGLTVVHMPYRCPF